MNDDRSSGSGPEKAVRVVYTNYRQETSERTILPERLWFGSTPWHPEPALLRRRRHPLVVKGCPDVILSDRELRALLQQGELTLVPFEDDSDEIL